jgi:hypothetical protein
VPWLRREVIDFLRSLEIKDTEAVGPGRALGELGGVGVRLPATRNSTVVDGRVREPGGQPGGVVSTLVRLRHGAAYGRLPRPCVSSTQP